MSLNRPIKEFNIDNRAWRIDWLGAIKRHPNKITEPNIDVVLSPLKDSSIDPTKTSSVYRNQRRVVSIGIGFLPELRICSVWKGGKPHKYPYEYKKESFDDIVIQPNTMRIIKASDSENGDLIINPKYYDFGADHTDANCLAIKNYRGFNYVIIPMTELIRFYYALSSDLAKWLVRGEVLGPHSWISKTTGEDAYVDGKNLKIKLDIPLKYRSELQTVARIIGSPEARRGAQMIHDSIVKDTKNAALPYPVTSFPFSGKTTLTCCAKRILQNEEKGIWNLLVLWIESCTGSFPYENIILDGGEQVLYHEIAVAKKQSGPAAAIKTQKVTIRAKSYRAGVIRNNTDSNAKLSGDEVLLTEDRFPALKDCKIYSNNQDFKREQRILIKNVYGASGNETTDFTTASDAPGSEAVRKLTIGIESEDEKKKRQPKKPAMPASFRSFIDCLNFIKKQYPDHFDFCLISATKIPADTFPTGYGTSNYFPEKTDKDKKLSWSFIDPRATTRRQVLVARVTYREHFLYLFEAEHNKAKGDAFTILLLNRRDFDQAATDELYEVILRSAKHRGFWFDTGNCPFPMLSGQKIKHSSENVEILSLRILAKIKFVCGELESEDKTDSKERSLPDINNQQ